MPSELTRLRTDAGLDVSQLAKRSGVAADRIRAYERGEPLKTGRDGCALVKALTPPSQRRAGKIYEWTGTQAKIGVGVFAIVDPAHAAADALGYLFFARLTTRDDALVSAAKLAGVDDAQVSVIWEPAAYRLKEFATQTLRDKIYGKIISGDCRPLYGRAHISPGGPSIESPLLANGGLN